MKNQFRALAALSIFCVGASLAPQTQAAAQRWNIDIKGLLQHSNSFSSASDTGVDKIVDVHGYFTGEDLDLDGIISQQEVLEIDLTGLWIPRYPFENPYPEWKYGAEILEFSYSPEGGLRYVGTQLYQDWDFGKQMVWLDKAGLTTITWLDNTQTQITAVPETSAISMGIVGLAVAALLMRRRERSSKA